MERRRLGNIRGADRGSGGTLNPKAERLSCCLARGPRRPFFCLAPCLRTQPPLPTLGAKRACPSSAEPPKATGKPVLPRPPGRGPAPCPGDGGGLAGPGTGTGPLGWLTGGSSGVGGPRETRRSGLVSATHWLRRYPTFIDALRDLDDALSMCFLFSTFPRTGKCHVHTIQLCRRLAVEFMHYVIAARALRKVSPGPPAGPSPPPPAPRPPAAGLTRRRRLLRRSSCPSKASTTRPRCWASRSCGSRPTPSPMT